MKITRYSHFTRATFLYSTLVVVIAGYFLFKLIHSYRNSLFMNHGERVNIFLYGQNAAYYSLDTAGGRHYVIYFFPDLKVQVPGGFGNYRTGSLGKLAYLEGEPDIMQKTMSFATTSFIHATFYPHTEDVYYGTQFPKSPQRPYLPHIFSYQSNASFFDRLYIVLLLFGTEDTDFDSVAYRENKGRVHTEDIFFQSDSFAKKSKGLLYQTKYRSERKNVQIRYIRNYQAAATISAIMQGTGIRVSDILQVSNKKVGDRCIVTEQNSNEFSITAKDTASYFGCRLSKGKTDIYDVVLLMGAELEEDWYVK